eukprot:TRINITY_DN755_c0_g1_i2.p1 TRINITY_DN755_c0_g1~~TRINITY_DN755_c0_g1_i2.p1  ORF type:complete len:1337 (-),score=374.11 TRINITY_DN755_c0_g1_i2:53-4033(-)
MRTEAVVAWATPAAEARARSCFVALGAPVAGAVAIIAVPPRARQHTPHRRRQQQAPKAPEVVVTPTSDDMLVGKWWRQRGFARALVAEQQKLWKLHLLKGVPFETLPCLPPAWESELSAAATQRKRQGKQLEAGAPSRKRRKYTLDESDEDSSSASFSDGDSSAEGTSHESSASSESSGTSSSGESSSSEGTSGGSGTDSNSIKKPKAKKDKHTDKRRSQLKPFLKPDQLCNESKAIIQQEEERRERLREIEEREQKAVKGVEEGRVVINRGHTDGEPDVCVEPRLAKRMFEHQIEAVCFLWKNMIMSAESTANGGIGCVLADAMGLGKTLTTIAFVQAFLDNKGSTVLIIVPVNVRYNWVDEFRKWLGRRAPRIFLVHKLKEQDKLHTIKKWHHKGGVLLCGFEEFCMLAGGLTAGRKKQCIIGSIPGEPAASACRRGRRRNAGEDDIVKTPFTEYLLDPGPDLVVVDEAHKIRNAGSERAWCLGKIKTPTRLCLTGYPLQNAVLEFWAIINFAYPHFLHAEHEFRNLFANPIQRGMLSDATPKELRVCRQRVWLLTEKLKSVVLRRDAGFLLRNLPPKHEFTVYCSLSPLQLRLYQAILRTDFSRLRAYAATHGKCKDALRVDDDASPAPITGGGSGNKSEQPLRRGDTFSLHSMLHLLCNHPALLLQSHAFASAFSASRTGCGSHSDTESEDDTHNAGSGAVAAATKVEAWEGAHMLDGYVGRELAHGAKLSILFGIIGEATVAGDKIAVFTQSVLTLDFIAEHLRSGGYDFYRIDGRVAAQERQKQLKRFNKPDNPVKVFIVSTKAGGLGVNLPGANRLVLFDLGWNPAHEIQAAMRVFRVGQKKPTYVYRLVCAGCVEENLYRRQLHKESLSRIVIDRNAPKRYFTDVQLKELFDLYGYDGVPASAETAAPDGSRGGGISGLPEEPLSDVGRIDAILKAVLEKQPGLIKRVCCHDLLLKSDGDTSLGEVEQAEAKMELAADESARAAPPPQGQYQRAEWSATHSEYLKGTTSQEATLTDPRLLLQQHLQLQQAIQLSQLQVQPFQQFQQQLPQQQQDTLPVTVAIATNRQEQQEPQPQQQQPPTEMRRLTDPEQRFLRELQQFSVQHQTVQLHRQQQQFEYGNLQLQEHVRQLQQRIRLDVPLPLLPTASWDWTQYQVPPQALPRFPVVGNSMLLTDSQQYDFLERAKSLAPPFLFAQQQHQLPLQPAQQPSPLQQLLIAQAQMSRPQSAPPTPPSPNHPLQPQTDRSQTPVAPLPRRRGRPPKYLRVQEEDVGQQLEHFHRAQQNAPLEVSALPAQQLQQLQAQLHQIAGGMTQLASPSQ